MKVLVDTPVWSLALRRKAEDRSANERRIADLLRQIIYDGRAELIGSVRQELLSGLREEAQFRRLRDYLRDFPDVVVATEDYEQAARAGKQCRKAGIDTTPVDMLICAVGLHHGWQVFTMDRDFVRYGTVLNIQLYSAA